MSQYCLTYISCSRTPYYLRTKKHTCYQTSSGTTSPLLIPINNNWFVPDIGVLQIIAMFEILKVILRINSCYKTQNIASGKPTRVASMLPRTHHGTAKSGLVAELNAIDGATRGDLHRRDTPGKMLGTQLPTSWLISLTHQGLY